MRDINKKHFGRTLCVFYLRDQKVDTFVRDLPAELMTSRPVFVKTLHINELTQLSVTSLTHLIVSNFNGQNLLPFSSSAAPLSPISTRWIVDST